MSDAVVLGARYNNEFDIYMTRNNKYFYVLNGERLWDIDVDVDLKEQLKHALSEKFLGIRSKNDSSDKEDVMEFGFDDFEQQEVNFDGSTDMQSQQLSNWLIENRISPYTPFTSILEMTHSLFNLPKKQIKSLFNSYCKTALVKPEARNPIVEFFEMLKECPDNFEYVHFKHKFKNDIRWKVVNELDRRKYFQKFKRLKNESNLSVASERLYSTISQSCTECKTIDEIITKIGHKIEFISLPDSNRTAIMEAYLKDSEKSDGVKDE